MTRKSSPCWTLCDGICRCFGAIDWSRPLSTGSLLNRELPLAVECVAHGPEGGDLMIGARVAEGKIVAVIFFRDPLTAQPHEPDVSALMRVCDVHQIPLATNPGTADAIVAWLDSRPITP